MLTKRRATIEDLYHVPENGKAEIINGELVRMSPTGSLSGRAAGKIFTSLSRHEEEHGGGYAYGDNVGFIVFHHTHNTVERFMVMPEND